ncbi:uncharacterized protein N7484_005266 [Penicillium longicatenatum]|uniref:uncharacterized protein n=1 Tax=Penicillium longicatenatum TaxID=1561947 RepID=UPI00254848B4|nr:uncharacterized protein N7484_005266 [Penicillium longicatenatum]KAJ5651543.1 hypothetical protein N7484_005266 [Penicillium longicatenatum]
MGDTGAVAYCGQQLVGVSIAIAVVQIVVVGARFYTRYIQKVACGSDDYLIIPALIASLGQSALYIFLVQRGGVGYHLEYVERTPQKLVILEKALYANEILDFPFTVAPAKISILLFYIRIFSFRNFRILAYIVGGIVTSHGVGVFFAAIFQCSPIAYTWDKTIVEGSCFDQEAFYRYVSPPNIITDVLILMMPLPYVWNLHTRVGQKVALTGVFLLGSLGTVASILRMTIFFQESAMTDPTWTSVKLGIWTILEGGIIIIAACLPSIWPLISKLVSRSLDTNCSSDQLQDPRYGHTSRHKRTGSRYSRLGASIEGAKCIIDPKMSTDVASGLYNDAISLVEVSRVREA